MMKSEIRNLPVQLTKEELKKYSEQYIHNENLLEALTSKVKSLKAQNKDINLKLTTLQEEREVECIWKNNGYISELYRIDTQQLVESRSIDAMEVPAIEPDVSFD